MFVVARTELHIITTHETRNIALVTKSTRPHHTHVCDDVLLPLAMIKIIEIQIVSHEM